jgi:hypothetical protein
MIGIRKFRDSLEYNSLVDQIISDVKLTQQLADSTHEICKIDFKPGGNQYQIFKGNQLFRSNTMRPLVQFFGKSYFSFVGSGFTSVGGSGTLYVGGYAKTKKIIVSSKGRIRVE